MVSVPAWVPGLDRQWSEIAGRKVENVCQRSPVKKFGLPKASLLRKPGEFMRVYQQGRRLKGTGFSLIFLAGDQPGSRFGISIHRMLRGAVRRNRIKRIVREVFRLNRDIFPQKCDIVFTVGPHFRLSSTTSVRQAVAGLAVRYQAQKTWTDVA